MRINYFSDIHLEFGMSELPDNDADLIVAAGDIGPNFAGLEWLKAIKKPVVYVAGNHEFYGHDFQQMLEQLKASCQDTQIHFLENAVFLYQDIRFIGCTLWTDLFVEGSDKVDILAKSLNDFKNIKVDDKLFEPNAFSMLHAYSRYWLEQELAKPFDGKTVVVTHHAPTQWSWNRAPNAIKKLAYCNDLKFLLHEYPVAAWFHGHVHNPADYRIAGARILSNPRGYASKKKLVADFDLNRVVDI